MLGSVSFRVATKYSRRHALFVLLPPARWRVSVFPKGIHPNSHWLLCDLMNSSDLMTFARRRRSTVKFIYICTVLSSFWAYLFVSFPVDDSLQMIVNFVKAGFSLTVLFVKWCFAYEPQRDVAPPRYISSIWTSLKCQREKHKHFKHK